MTALTRRSILTAILFAPVTAALPPPALARSMYCTRHRRACQERRERQRRAEYERRSKMTPEQRAAEDAAARRDQAEWEKREASRVTRLEALVGVAAAALAALVGSLVFIAVKDEF